VGVEEFTVTVWTPLRPPVATAPCAIAPAPAADGQDEMLGEPMEPEGAVGPACTPVAALEL
jgi:hypothetical protein